MKEEIEKWKKENEKDGVVDKEDLLVQLKERKNKLSKKTLGRHVLNREIHNIQLEKVISIKEKHCLRSLPEKK